MTASASDLESPASRRWLSESPSMHITRRITLNTRRLRCPQFAGWSHHLKTNTRSFNNTAPNLEVAPSCVAPDPIDDFAMLRPVQ
jgi:hypothetical protein